MSFRFELPLYRDDDGMLGTFEPAFIPGFKINRIFYIFNVPASQYRANHACMNAAIVFVVMTGSVVLSVESDGEVHEYKLAHSNQALYISPASWVKAYDFKNNAILVGLSNKRYQDCWYIEDYTLYKEYLRGLNK